MHPAPINAVIFDFHDTLVAGGEPGRWIEDAFRHLATAPTPTEGLPAHLDRLWHHAHTIDPDSERDLSADRHRDVFTRTIALLPDIAPELIAALYAVLPDQWTVFDDTLPVLRELKARGVKIAVLSNIGLDIRGCLERAGVADLIDAVVLSFEVGLVKPDPAIFAHVLKQLDVRAGETLMVGDSPRDDIGGVSLGIRTLILPRTEGPVHGLGVVTAFSAPPAESRSGDGGAPPRRAGTPRTAVPE
ncbi:HAD family hydrolase [Paractinoplanes toevensis]|uniref:Hydrolase n=1 Tax=Paractinoplanes toevensis TaxID=571911 RepID=A0A919TG02_9ACTN|nr:HAD family hydrolase [Actinoplanes toevensis]GIM93715.1 hydrolase [Actinoplanes toevensis]